MDKKSVLVFGVGELQISIITRAKAMGLFVVGIDPFEDAVAKDYCDAFEVVGGQDFIGTIDVAKKYKTTSAAVERGIRLLIHHMWKAQTPAWQELFPEGKRPTVSELFPIMVDYLSYEDAS